MSSYADIKEKAIDESGHAIERIFVKQYQREEIRFSWWPNGRYVPRSLDLSEEELLPLFKDASKKGVFSEQFLAELRDFLNERNDNEA